MTLKNNIEGIIIKWAYQIEEVNTVKLGYYEIGYNEHSVITNTGCNEHLVITNIWFYQTFGYNEHSVIFNTGYNEHSVITNTWL